MKIRHIRILSIVLTVVLLLGLLTACDSGTADGAASSGISQTPEKSTETESEVSGAETEVQEESIPSVSEAAASEAGEEEEAGQPQDEVLEAVELPVVDSPVHYTCWRPMAPYVSELINLENFSEEIAIVKQINEMTNVYIDFEAVPGGPGEDEKFNLMIAAGDYCDLIGAMSLYSTGFEGAINDEVIIDVRESLEEYAPNYMKLLKADQRAYLNMLTDSGQMGGIAQLLKRRGTENQGLIIRKDWMTASGRERPSTIDEMEEYIQFCKDEYGAYARINYTGNDSIWGASYNVNPGGFMVDDGKIVHSYETQGYQDYLEKMSDWYTKGLFNDTFYNDTDVTTIRDDMANNLCCAVEGSAESMSNIYGMNRDNHVMELCAVPYLKSEGVDEIHCGFQADLIKNPDSWAVSSACGDVVPLMKLINWLYSEEGQIIYNWGEEGVTFTYDDAGSPQWTDLVINNPDGLSYMFASYLYATGQGSSFYPGVYDMGKGTYAYTDDQLEAVDIFAELTDEAMMVDKGVQLTLEEQTEYAKLQSEMSTYADGEVLRFVTGERSVDTYDDFLNTVISMGLDRMKEIEQAAYDRYLEKLES